jgi:hypothetical protein
VSLVAWLFIGAVIWTTIIVTWSSANLTPAAATAVAVVLSPQSSEPLLLGVRVDVCADDEANDVEKGHPGGLGQELLGKSQRDGGDDPADLHDGPETSLDGCADLVECTGAGNEGHRDEVDAVLDGGDLGRVSATRSHRVSGSCTYEEVADENLHNLRLEALASLEDLLEEADEDMAKGRANDGAVQGHLGHARGEVVAALTPVVGDPRGEELLQAREGARSEHLGPQRVALQLLQVRLTRAKSAFGSAHGSHSQHSQQGIH